MFFVYVDIVLYSICVFSMSMLSNVQCVHKNKQKENTSDRVYLAT